MARYKFADETGTIVNDTDNGIFGIHSGSRFWEEYQTWVAEGGVTDPYKNHDDYVADALALLWEHHDGIISSHGLDPKTKGPKNQSKVQKALRKEAKGTATPEEEALLDDNDTLDVWYDDMERTAEDDGESWIEDPSRTEEELKAFDPATDISWPAYPFI